MKISKVHLFNKKKDRLHQLRAFYYVARLGTMSEAAKCMSVTQSAITQQIKMLENDIKFKLFARESRPMSLTQKGQDLYKNIAPVITNFETIVEDFLEEEGNERNREVSIAAHHIAISHIMPEVINEFKKLDLNSKIIFRNIPPAEAIERLKNREIDLAFYPFYNYDPELKYTEIVQHKPVLIINKNNPLATREINGLEDLRKYDFIRIDKKLITIPFFEETLSNYNLKGSIDFENGNWEMLINLVKKNDFVAVVSDICIDKNSRDSLVVKDLSKFFPAMKYSLAHRGNHQMKDGVKNFIDSIKKYAESKRD